MSKLLVLLLGVQERKFRDYIERLETMSSRQGIDIRLATEIDSTSKVKIRELGLDAADTTSKELYFALRTKLMVDDQKLVESLKLNKQKPDTVASRLAKMATKLSQNEQVLCLTVAGTKKMLTAVPPKKTLRLLKYRSLASVIKREDPRALYTIATFIEDSSWRSQIHAKMRRSDIKDIAWQPAEVVPIPHAWVEKISSSHLTSAYIQAPEVGAVCLVPNINVAKNGSTLLTLAMLLTACQKLAVDSLPYRRSILEFGPQFALPEIAHGKQPKFRSMHGLIPSWRGVYQLIGSGILAQNVVESEFITSKIIWELTETKMSKLLEQMNFWVGTQYVAFASDGRPVSMNVVDVAHDLVMGLEYEHRTVEHMEVSLWNELQLRYLKQEIFSNSLQKQLSETYITVVT